MKRSEFVAKTGLTQALFYFNFKSKEDIFQQIFQNFDQQLIKLRDVGKIC
ncbi:TetR/AcrR family transcriptional regulator [Aeribacillus sp. FSL K6-2848]|nr:TetR/AcrR family transcriptional regulator [Aeribacillus pallidus]